MHRTATRLEKVIFDLVIRSFWLLHVDYALSRMVTIFPAIVIFAHCTVLSSDLRALRLRNSHHYLRYAAFAGCSLPVDVIAP